jgi:FlaA1/EpsC-like NDP-sugar epimerase
MINYFSNPKSFYKTFIAVVYDSCVSSLAFYLALTLRHGNIKPKLLSEPFFLKLLLLITCTQSLVFYVTGLYQGIWRYSSTNDLLQVFKASVMAVVASFVAAFFYMRLDGIPRSLVVIDWLVLFVLLGGGRFFYRIFTDHYTYQKSKQLDHKKALIIGAGAGGEKLFREIRKNHSIALDVVGFVDDSPGLQKRTLHGVPILGNIQDLPKLVEKNNVEQILIAIPSLNDKRLRAIYSLLKPLNVDIKILPKMSDVINKRIEFSNLRHIKIEDLLGREEIQLELDKLKAMLSGKKVLVTGGGGSIGSVLCEQLSMFAPRELTIVDVCEFNAYSIDQILRKKFPELALKTIVGDVRDRNFIENLFQRERPEIVFHAAAYKHVPLMEFNPFEAIRTNVLGTQIVTKAAIKHEVERFVLISTDKAVNPTNVMGATKRIAEIILQSLKTRTIKTKLMTVRFGNVLGSSGSVIPLFTSQIAEGGPVTVTHENITRYFMSIPEATKLVLQAGAMGNGGELFVLDMGEPIKIMDLAKEMISLAGLIEGEDIQIHITGLRPGEKLYEEPLLDSEHSLETSHPKVKISKARGVDASFEEKLHQILQLGCQSNRLDFISIMKSIVPEYRPMEEGTTSPDEEYPKSQTGTIH